MEKCIRHGHFNLSGVRWSKLALNLAICILVDGHVGKSFRHPKAIWIAVQLITEVLSGCSTGVEMEAIEGTLDLKALLPAERPLLKRIEWCGACFFALRYFRLESSMWRE